MTRFNRSLARTGIAGLAVGLASVVAAGTAAPAGAAVPPTAAQPDHPQLTGTTPMCLVGAALFYPMFLGGVLFTNPGSLVSAAPGYWSGGAKGDFAGAHGSDSHGWLPACGLPEVSH
jgi:hypothetical protein